MTPRKRVVTPPPPSTAPPAINPEEKPAMQQEEKSQEFQTALDELLNLYPPGSEGLECRVYKLGINNSKDFVDKMDFFPDEMEIKNKYGSGKFYLYCSVFESGKRRFLKSPVVNIIESTTPNTIVKNQPIDINNANGILEQIRAFKEAGLIPSANSNSESNITPIMNMMIENNKSNMLLLLKMLENSNKPAPSTNDAIMQVLLTKALDKSDPMKEINTILKIKDSLASDAAPSDGGDFMSIIGKSLPFILQMAANSGGAAPAKVPNPGTPQIAGPKVNPAIQQKKIKSEILMLIKDDIKELVKDAIHEYNNESENPDTPLLPEDDNYGTVKEFEDTANVHELEKQEENNSTNNFDINDMSLGEIAAQIKAAPEEAKIATLKIWLERAPLEKVKEFIIDNKVVDTELEFWQYVKKCEHEELIPEGIIV